MEASKGKPRKLLGFDRARVQRFFKAGHEGAGLVSTTAGLLTVVVPNPVTGAVAFGAKVVEAAFGIGVILLSDDPFTEAVGVAATFFAGKAAGAVAKQVLKVAKQTGLLKFGVDQVKGLAKPLIDKGLAAAGRVLTSFKQSASLSARFAKKIGAQIGSSFNVNTITNEVADFVDLGNDALQTFRKSSLQGAQELGALLDQGSAFVRNAVTKGENIANGLAKEPAVQKAKAIFSGAKTLGLTAVANAVRFFTGCIAFCGGTKKDEDGTKLTLTDPLVLDLGADGVAIVNQADSTVFFDMDVSGTLQHMSWIGPDDGFLVRDKNGNGVIDDGSELFGFYTDPASNSGLEALGKLDANKDGVVSAADPLFAELRVWRDFDFDGVSQPAELSSLDEYGIVALPLTKIPTATGSPLGDVVFGGDAATTRPGASAVLLFEVGLLVVSDPVFIRGPDLQPRPDQGPGLLRQYFGRDTSSLVVLTRGTNVTGHEAAVFFGSFESDTFDGSARKPAFPMFVRAGAGDDTLIGGSRPDQLAGGSGADSIDGGAGNDMLWIDSDDVFVSGGAGFDVVIVEGARGVTIDMFAAEVEVLYAGPGDDTIIMSGGSYGVKIRADSGDDYIQTGSGDDTINPGPGDDIVDAGEGEDTVQFSGKFDEYTLKVDTDASGRVRVTITDNGGEREEEEEDIATDGTDVIVGAERLEFDDRTFVLDSRNSAPVIPPVARRTTRGAAKVYLSPFEITSLAIEFDGEDLTLSGVGPVTNGQVSILANGTVVFAADEGFAGLALLAFTVEDPNGNRATSSMPFRVLPAVPTDTLFGTQWHHDDTRAIAVWDSGHTGKGVTVRANDDSCEIRHPDLAPNVDEASSFHFRLNRQDPTPPDDSDEHHGTFVLGLIAAARNGFGIVGTAYDATSSFTGGFGQGRMDDVDVVSLSFGARSAPIINGGVKDGTAAGTMFSPHDLTSTDAQTRSTLSSGKMQRAAETGRGGLGTVVVTSAGNDRTNWLRGSALQIQSSRYTMSIGAHGKTGDIAYFSSVGSNTHVSCPGKDITSTDRTGNVGYSVDDDKLSIGTDYANGQGTSYSAPICAGIVAVAVQANPVLGWRDFQEIMALSALSGTIRGRGSSAADPLGFAQNKGGKALNGAGLHHSEAYGFGLADAFGAVRLAETWLACQSRGLCDRRARTSANERIVTSAASPNAAIPDNGAPATSRLAVTTGAPGMRIMNVEVGLSIAHARIGDLVVTITSPSGTEATIMDRPLYDQDKQQPDDFGSVKENVQFLFTAARFWGEDADGTWVLKVRDDASGQSGTLSSWTLHLSGDDAPTNNVYVFTEDFGVGDAVAGSGVVSDSNGGRDTINTSPCRGSVVIDLTAGASGRTQIEGRKVLIADESVIENAFSGDGDDTLIGNDAPNTLSAGRGDDLIIGSAGSDAMLGGDGDDIADYSTSPAAVQVSLGAGTASGGFAAGDTLTGVENLIGSRFGDDLEGDAEGNTIKGGFGADTIRGGAGDDRLFGGSGDDRLFGGSGDDLLAPSVGADDRVTGGDGVDTVEMLGHSTDYAISFAWSAAVITDGSNTVTCEEVEFVKFSDKIQLLSPVANEAPTITSARVSTPENTPVTIPLGAIVSAASDPEGDQISFGHLASVTNGEVVLLADSAADCPGCPRFQPDAEFNGEATVVVSVHDNHGNYAAVAILITVTPVNTQPTANNAALSVPVVSILAKPVAARVEARDVDGDTLTYTLVTPPASDLPYAVTMAPDGAYTLAKDRARSRSGQAVRPGDTFSFEFKATDPGGLSCTATVAVRVTGTVALTTPIVRVTSGDEASAQYSHDFGVNQLADQDGICLGVACTPFGIAARFGGPKLTTLTTGNIVYTWCGVGIDGEGMGVAAAMYDSLGNVIQPVFQVNTHEALDQSYPGLTALHDGGFVIVWHSRQQDSSSNGCYLQRFDKLGFKLGRETLVNDEVTSFQGLPVIDTLASGGVVVAWQSFGQDGSKQGIYAKLFTADMLPAGAEFQVNTFTEGFQDHVQVAAMPEDGADRWIAVWNSNEQDGDGHGIFAQVFTGETTVGAEFQVNSGVTLDQVSPDVCAIPPLNAAQPGTFAVVWRDGDRSPAPSASSLDVSGRVVSAAGVPVGGEVRVNKFQTEFDQVAPAIFYVPGAGPVALWDTGAVFLQKFDNAMNHVTEGKDNRKLVYQPVKDTSKLVFKPLLKPVINTRGTLRPAGSGALNGGVVIGWQENDFTAKTLTQKLAFLLDRDNLVTGAPLTLIGTAGSDTLIGDAEDDLFYGSTKGNDVYNGQQGLSGNDRVVYTSPASEYEETRVGPGHWTIRHRKTGDVDTLLGIELIQYSNGLVRINTLPSTTDDVLVPLAGGKRTVDVTRNDYDVEDNGANPERVTIVDAPSFGTAAYDPKLGLTVTFTAGEPIGYSSIRYSLSDAEGLTSLATVRITWPCAALSGTDVGEVIATGATEDAAACNNSFTLTGRRGQDTFLFTKREGGVDTVTDFAVDGEDADKIGLAGYKSITSFETVLLDAKQRGQDTILTLESNHQVVLLNVVVGSLSAGNFAGSLGKSAEQVNTFGGMRYAENLKILNKHMYTITKREADQQGALVVGELNILPEQRARSLVVWEASRTLASHAFSPNVSPRAHRSCVWCARVGG